MRPVAVALVAALVAVAYLPLGLTFPSTAPALLWSPYQDGIKEAISYQTLSAKDLVASVMSKGGWSNYLCSGKEAQHQSLDLVLIFVGGELQSLDTSGNKHADPSMVELLRDSYSKSNFSLAFPYVAAASEAMESSLVSAFSESCVGQEDSEFSDVAFMDSCFVEGDSFKKLSDSHSLHDYLVSSIERPKGKASLIVGCHKGLHSLRDADRPHSESQVFSEIMGSVEQSGAKYAVLYVSDPSSSSIRYPSSRELERFLAESGNGSSTRNSTIGCDGVCQIKSSLLEGLLVAIVLLVILISGLCCMMGIDTPTRFETPQDS